MYMQYLSESHNLILTITFWFRYSRLWFVSSFCSQIALLLTCFRQQMGIISIFSRPIVMVISIPCAKATYFFYNRVYGVR